MSHSFHDLICDVLEHNVHSLLIMKQKYDSLFRRHTDFIKAHDAATFPLVCNHEHTPKWETFLNSKLLLDFLE